MPKTVNIKPELIPQLRIAIVDDHMLIRKSLCYVIDSFEGMKVVIDADNGQSFLDQLENCPIDVVLLDIQMPVMNGFLVCKHLVDFYPNIKILIVSQYISKHSIHKVMEIGGHGYFTKNSDPEQLEKAIRSVHENGYYFGTDLGSVIREAILWDKKNINKKVIPVSEISFREIEIIELICKEFSSKEIASKLFIEPRTVEKHRHNIMEKTNSQNIIGIVLYALKTNMVQLEDL
jgi:two-component system, NarL family, response regulator DegU